MADVDRPITEATSEEEIIDVTDSSQSLQTRTLTASVAQVLPLRGQGVRPGHRGWYIGLAVALVCSVVLAAFLFATKTPPLVDLSAEVTSAGELPLSFPQAGTLTQLFVHSGEFVRQGQVIAQESVSGLSQQVIQDQETVRSDHAEESVLRSILKSQQTTFRADQGSLTTIMTQELVVAEQAVSAAQSQQQAIAAANAAVVSASKNELSLAQSTEQTECAGVNSGTPASSSVEADCLNAQNKVATGQVALAQAQATQTVESANATVDMSQSQHALLADQAVVAAEQTSQLPSYVSLQSDLASVEAETTKDQAALSAAQGRAASQNLVAPVSGTVESVNGAAGEVTGQTGISAPGSGGSPVAVSPGFQLFPAAQTQTAASTASAPIAVLVSSRHVLIDVLVPESQINLVKVGSRAVFTPSIAGLRILRGVVQQVFPRPTIAAGVVSYEVQILALRGARYYLDGVTGTVTIARSK